MILGGWGSVNLGHLLASPPLRLRLLLTRRERCSFDDRGVILTLIIQSLLFLPWCSESTLAIWRERLVKGPYTRKTPHRQSNSNLRSIDCRSGHFYQLRYPGTVTDIEKLIMHLPSVATNGEHFDQKGRSQNSNFSSTESGYKMRLQYNPLIRTH